MTSRGLGRLTGSKRVTWLGNADFKIYITPQIFSIWHARQWRKLGQPTFSVPAMMPASTRENTSLG